MTTFQIVAAAIVAVFSAARITRLVVFDSWPPVAWVRAKWIEKAPENWQPLLTCGYCFGVYPSIGIVVWALFADLTDWTNPWWIFNGIFALAYAASIVVAFDGEVFD